MDTYKVYIVLKRMLQLLLNQFLNGLQPLRSKRMLLEIFAGPTP